MKIDSIQVGPIMTNCYLLCDDAAGVCCVIDPGDEPARVEQMVQRSGCELRYILLTHGHFDHCTGVAGMLERHPELPVYICEKGRDRRRGQRDAVCSPAGEEPALL